MLYENFVPLIATRRLVYRRPTSDNVSAEPPPQHSQNSTYVASQLPQVEEMTFKF